MSFSCQGTARYHSMSWHFLILVLALFDRKMKMQPGINSENMIHSLWVGWATTLHIGFEILNWFKIPMMVVNRVSSKTYWDRAIFFVFTERNILGAKQSQVKKCGHLTQARNINAGLEQFEVKYYSRFSSQTRTLNKQLIAYNRHFGLRQGNKMLRVSKPTILLDSSNLLLASI